MGGWGGWFCGEGGGGFWRFPVPGFVPVLWACVCPFCLIKKDEKIKTILNSPSRLGQKNRQGHPCKRKTSKTGNVGKDSNSVGGVHAKKEWTSQDNYVTNAKKTHHI